MSEQTNTTQIAKVIYTAKTHTPGGRDGGASRTSGGRLDVKFRFLAPLAAAPIRSSYSLPAGRTVFSLG
jgi:hypothetical protein